MSCKCKVQSRELIYLACPYSHADEKVMHDRFIAVNKIAARLMKEGKYIFSPISHTHPIKLAGDLPPGWDYWEGYDRRILSTCDRIIVLKLDGYQQSTGVQSEIKIGEEMGIPVDYIDYIDDQ
jgi:hypothetical protein